ncbi:MAG: SRPBCC domain-containing protein [Myxococcales bacterium]|nr:SRPBCC domain-containing protein [Myxococcales bacterium]
MNTASRRRRWTAAFAALLVPLTCSCKHIHTEVVIDAPSAAVWEVLRDTDAYPAWNPYHVRVDGVLAEGERLEVEVHKPNGNELVIHPRVEVLEAERELTWGGGVPGVFVGHHVFRLVPLPGDRTRLIHTEVFRGIAVPFAELDTIEAGYEQVNRALAERVESRQREAAL